MGGLLTTLGLPMVLGDESTLFEDGVASELTVWFRPRFEDEPALSAVFMGYSVPC